MEYTFDDFKDRIVFAFSTRNGGVSEPPYDTLNLSFSMGDDPEKVRKNYEIWCGSLGVDTRSTVLLGQTHSDHVLRVGRADCGRGLYRDRIPDTDAMVTDEPGVALVTGHADCVPVYLYDPVRQAIGLAHAGWRGTVAEIAGKTVRKMTEEFGTDPANLCAMIGPCISMRYFECDRDVIDAIKAMSFDVLGTGGEDVWYYDENAGKYHVSLSMVNRLVLEAAGVPADHIDLRDTCTYAHPELYFSHRRDGMARGGQQALLMLR